MLFMATIRARLSTHFVLLAAFYSAFKMRQIDVSVSYRLVEGVWSYHHIICFIQKKIEETFGMSL